jgi:uroporphyrinogen III methyltransferase/synthase
MTNSDVANSPADPTATPPRTRRGIVYLVGAGPGDPGLLTLRGAKLLELADLVVYDALANPALLRHCQPHAERIYVGKRAASHSMTQEQINNLLVEHGLAGKTVVRLKGGDPMVFGRGGEECQALAAAGVAFEVVPGITAALAAPAYAGIPVTHRDLNSSFTFVTGHEKEESLQEADALRRQPGDASDLDWAALARLPCLAFYMGVKSLPRIVDRLVAHGMDPSTPAATIHRGTTPQQRTVTAALAGLPAAVATARLAPPALTIIGKVVELRATLSWFERRPLFGQTIIVTRSRDQASTLAERFEELGAFVLEQPTIELVAPAEPAAIVELFRSLANGGTRFDWVIFTSATGVAHARRQLLEQGLDVQALHGCRIATVGDATADAVRQQLCRRVELCPPHFTAGALADALEQRGDIRGQRFLLLRADIARPVLVDRLHAHGAAEVRDVSIYENRALTRLSPEVAAALESGRVDWITFTSSSTARNFLAMLPGRPHTLPAVTKMASIGPMTTLTLRAANLTPLEAARHDIDGLIELLVDPVPTDAVAQGR